MIDSLNKQLIWSDETKLPSWTLEEYEKESQHNDLILIDDFAIDVKEFKSQHPGGSKLLTNYIGKDATKSFYGVLNNHTKSARQMMRDMRVAKVNSKKSD
jgi:stearoyl-CoA desaturase (delta-9 desaturase)